MAIHTLTGEVGRALPVLMLGPWDILGTSGSLLGGRASCPPIPPASYPVLRVCQNLGSTSFSEPLSVTFLWTLICTLS